MKPSAPARLALVTLLAACACAPTGAVKVNEQSDEARAPARPPDCAIEFLFKPPDRPYEPLGDLQSHVTAVTTADPWLTLRPKACELGADAVIITRNQVLNIFNQTMVEGTAIRFRPVPVYVEVPVSPPVSAPTPAPTPEAKPAPAPEPTPPVKAP